MCQLTCRGGIRYTAHQLHMPVIADEPFSGWTLIALEAKVRDKAAFDPPFASAQFTTTLNWPGVHATAVEWNSGRYEAGFPLSALWKRDVFRRIAGRAFDVLLCSECRKA